MLENNVFLIGFMGTGKSTIASCFGADYAMNIVEMDKAIVEKARMSIADIFAQYGEEYFRDLETTILKETGNMKNTVVSCGGGIVLRKENVNYMKQNGKIVLLTASPEEIVARVKNDNERPLLKESKDIESVNKLMEARRVKYEEAADVIIHTDGKSKEIICKELISKLQRAKERE